MFDKAHAKLLRYPEGITTTSYNIPDSVTYIGNNAFDNCTNLKTVAKGPGFATLGISKQLVELTIGGRTVNTYRA